MFTSVQSTLRIILYSIQRGLASGRRLLVLTVFTVTRLVLIMKSNSTVYLLIVNAKNK